MRAQLSAIELAAGLVLGRERSRRAELLELQRRADPCPPAEAVVRAAARAAPSDPSTPYFVMFSGGLDSSLLLACITMWARRCGRPDPIPVTIRYGEAASDETHYQEIVIRHLGVDDWVRLDAGGRADLLSEDACADLRASGMSGAARVPGGRWLFRTLGTSGTIVTGEGGDELFGSGPAAAYHFLISRLRRRQDVSRAVSIALTDVRRRTRRSSRRILVDLPDWLTPAGRAAVARAFAATYVTSALTVRGAHRDYYAMRGNTLIATDIEQQAREYGITYAEPFMDGRFIAELTSVAPDRHFIDRNRFFHHYFSDLLPPEVVYRSTKASFNNDVFGERSKEFAARFEAFDCLPLDLVDPERVRHTWLSGDDARSGLMLQHAWLATDGGR